MVQTLTEEIFREDATARTCEATVVAVRPGGLVLDRTVFYPQGGGQPGDTGALSLGDGTVLTVCDTVYDAEDGAIVHVLAPDTPAPAPGASVNATITWERRHRLMRLHTCLHLISRLTGGKITGAGIGEDKGRIDLDLPGPPPDREALAQRLSEALASDAPVRVRWITDAELDAQPDLVRTLSVAPPRGSGRVRLVEIEGVDVQPCGGTHVRSLGEIAPVRLGKIESKGKQNRRITVVLDD
ncbi:alanyl-tRNA editing protein [Pararhodospirillum photometricum]|uniref:Alanine--tRNA ligase n=1 Tax=Pararhodospirillum photometricum DSM 122 TaxID=1150469 RepID=H6SR60_PARPM|nr:alanyl-tRNA editing protein [Pararhodospirillum photometricum]CCG09782.1 Alanyl-tRNA synthetase AlaS [Pararhodospirillum photometricum DSM 122]